MQLQDSQATRKPSMDMCHSVAELYHIYFFVVLATNALVVTHIAIMYICITLVELIHLLESTVNFKNHS